MIQLAFLVASNMDVIGFSLLYNLTIDLLILNFLLFGDSNMMMSQTESTVSTLQGK